MKSLRKQTISLILQNEISGDVLFGDRISRILFEKNRFALLIDDKNKRSVILHSERVSKRSAFLNLTDVLGTISYLEALGLVYITREQERSDFYLFYEGKDFLHPSQILNKYIVNKDVMLTYSDDGDAELSDSQCLYGFILPEELFSTIERLFCGVIFPTKELKDFVDRNYRTEEQALSHHSLLVAWVAIAVSIVLGLFSIITHCD